MLRKIVVFTFPESQLSIIAISQNTERGNGRNYSHKSTNMSMIRKKIYQTLIVNIQIFNFKIDKKKYICSRFLKGTRLIIMDLRGRMLWNGFVIYLYLNFEVIDSAKRSTCGM